ncbi:MAG: DUF2791 family P-loop domain-containing protein [Clostridiales bacterium]|nr:DUF2791 family P-loop domain-containing protein [Clostridiales bacterium]
MARKAPAVPKRISAAVLNSLSAGVVPRLGLEYIAIGRKNEISALLDDLDVVESGGSVFRLISGRYGSGKSFLIQLMRSNAMERGFAVCDCDLSPERRLAGSQGQGLATYRELIRNLSVKASPDGNALPGILTKWISSVQLSEAKKHGYSPGSPELARATELAIMEKTSSFQSLVHGFDFSYAVSTFYRGVAEGDETKKQAALKWLRAEYTTKTQARHELSVSSIITDDTWYDCIKLVSALMPVCGYKGLIVFIDEAVNLYKIVQTVSRESNYEKLLNIFNDCMQGKLSHTAFFMGGTPQFIHDNRRGLASYEALRSRLVENRFATAGMRDYRGPILTLDPLTPEELIALLKRIVYIHSVHYSWEVPVSDEELVAFARSLTEKMGAETLLTPREVVRDFTGLLNLLHQNPDKTFETLASEIDIKGASEEESIDEEYAEFEL